MNIDAAATMLAELGNPHILHMVSVGIVTQTREGRSLRCRIEYAEVRSLLDFLMEDCCAGLDAHDEYREEVVG